MGYITITIGGSFRHGNGPVDSTQFSAMDHGHADAVAKAIEWLAGEVLPAAIAQDHKLAAEGATPTDGFGRTTS